ncbi:MAG TPA: glutathione S-transferase N-terminal domain-containing protein, partial [Rhizomicrobium sp.]|nr:glutathione S-transferase N-terminal domain-containing protein [Rhizomicrobium sp.]
MKLYYSPGACSLSPHIVAEEMGLTLDYERVDLKTHRTAGGADFYAINPKGYVPALTLDDGSLLGEGPAIVQYLADLKPDSGLLP